jgi:GNAT superfamily N-acetyltransferase
LISRLTEADRADWEIAVRAYHEDSSGTFSAELYGQTWARLLDGTQIRGVAARSDGRLVGFAHYYFHTGVWADGDSRCYLHDLYVAPQARRRGIAQALIEWVARDAEQHGATLLHWHTLEGNASARALYDKVAEYTGYLSYRRKL